QEEHIQKTMLNIKGRFGKNAILRASSLQEEGTMQFRNTLVGGHNGE
ncbi:MAG: DNA repair protein, partial [Veillonella sp.]|nr:DNA repair protein [Veillonella sp.]